MPSDPWGAEAAPPCPRAPPLLAPLAGEAPWGYRAALHHERLLRAGQMSGCCWGDTNDHMSHPLLSGSGSGMAWGEAGGDIGTPEDKSGARPQPH